MPPLLVGFNQQQRVIDAAVGLRLRQLWSPLEYGCGHCALRFSPKKHHPADQSARMVEERNAGRVQTGD